MSKLQLFIYTPPTFFVSFQMLYNCFLCISLFIWVSCESCYFLLVCLWSHRKCGGAKPNCIRANAGDTPCNLPAHHRVLFQYLSQGTEPPNAQYLAKWYLGTTLGVYWHYPCYHHTFWILSIIRAWTDWATTKNYLFSTIIELL